MTTSQELNPVPPPPSPSPRPIQNIGIKPNSFTHPTQFNQRLPVTTQPSSNSEHSSTSSSSSSSIDFQRLSDTNDPYAEPPSTPKPSTNQSPTVVQTYPNRPNDPFSHQTTTTRVQFTTPRPTLQGFPQGVRQGAVGEGSAELNRQLRDLLQRQQQQQQFKKIDEQLLPGKGQQRIWPPNDGTRQDTAEQPNNVCDNTFRHPLPPGVIRQRAPVPIGGVLRQPVGVSAIRMQGSDPRAQNLDSRMRLLLQQQQQVIIICFKFITLSKQF